MKRVFITVGSSFMLSLLILNHFMSDSAFIFLIVTAVLSAVSFLIKPLRKQGEIPCALISCVLAAVSFISVTELFYKPQLKFEKVKCDITATVIDTPTISSGGNYSYLIKTSTINGEKKKIRMRLYTPYDISAEPFDEITFTSTPFIPGTDKSMADYFKAKRTYICAYTKFDVHIFEPEKKPFYSFFYLRKLKSQENVRSHLDGDYAEFAVSLLFGDKTYFSGERRESFSLSGLSHIMAVSGLHMSVWVMGLYLILQKIGFENRVCGGLCIVAVWCLAAFCAFSPSVVRAAIMMSVYFSASFFSRRGDSLNSLGIAAFIICAINPFTVCDTSFLLSFFATLGIIIFSSCFPVLLRKRKTKNILFKAGRYLLSATAVCVSASLFTVPVLIRSFSSLNTLVVPGNLAVSFLIPLCLLLSGILSLCPPSLFIAYPVKMLLLALEKYIFIVVDFIGSLTLSKVFSESILFTAVLPLGVILSALIIYTVRKKSVSATALIIAASAAIITLS